MDIGFLFRGMGIGISIAAPVGPITLLLVRRTLIAGRLTGFISGLGVATADGLYGSIAAFGLTVVSSILIGISVWLRVIGGLFLIYLGIKTLLAKPADHEAQVKSNARGLIGAYTSMLLLTLTNPLTILAFAGVFAGVGIADLGRDAFSTGLLALGVFCGSVLWQSGISVASALFRSRLTPQNLIWVNRLSGFVIAGFGAAILVSLIGGQ